jgi:hypothetical protein
MAAARPERPRRDAPAAGRPDLAALLVDPARVAFLTDAVYRVALVDLLEVRAPVGAVFGDRVRVGSSGPVGPWPPPAGCRLLISARRIDSNGTTVLTAACPCCGATTRNRAGSAWCWCCRRCHPDPRASQTDHSDADSAAQTHPLFAATRANGFPSVSLAPVHPGATIISTAAGWSRFVKSATSEEVAAARAALLTRED